MSLEKIIINGCLLLENALNVHLVCAKWRLLGKDIEVSSDKAIHNIIKCACILHNVVREKDGDSDLDYCQEKLHSHAQENQLNNLHERANHGGARRGSIRAKEIRGEYANFFLDH